jgi:hypothetical protein
MRKIFFAVVMIFALAYACLAQTVEIGATTTHSTNQSKPDGAPGGGQTFFGIYAKPTFKITDNIHTSVRVDATDKARLATLFVTDHGTPPKGEVSAWGEVRYYFGKVGEGKVNHFLGAGAEVFKHFGLPEGGSRSYGVNPTASYGAIFGAKRGHRAAYAYLFRDKGTGVYGHRAYYEWTKTVSARGAIKFGIEANRVNLTEQDRFGYVDGYGEFDNIFKASIAGVFNLF